MKFNDDTQLFFKPKLDLVITNNKKNGFNSEFSKPWSDLLDYFTDIGWHEARQTYTDATDKMHAIIAFHDKKPIAFALYKKQRGTKTFNLDSMYVEPVFRFKGIGGKLIKAVKSHVITLKGEKLVLIDASSYEMPWIKELKNAQALNVPKASIYEDHNFEANPQMKYIKSCKLT